MNRNRVALPWPLALTLGIIATGILAASMRSCRAQERPTSYIVIQSVFVASAGFDLASTLYYYPRCRPACSEGNWLLRPAVEAGPIPTILVGTILTGITVWTANKLWQHKPFGRKVWWIIPVAGTVNHFLAAKANMELMR